jgi:transposase-like protein
MTIKIGGLGQEISCYCPVCSQKMTHWAHATGRTIRYSYDCESCELSLKSDQNGYAHLLTEMELYK